ncbi:pantoate--beta-alanine ligase [Thalassolituus alkanivorans]|uniref:pantoate--beta-alanine ligase n=1 Tax=Thalassolituus alkanivorans TaxID=2881055 RepID=UPI001E5E5F46|nr:pantoate--beta-alanine ligase [Thalassolituus alkanivorans]MCB2388488.1 pantoate--beta-alanine ligase [Thalassolituus alkanivorans]MCB2423794.1 pantoate--beta-alanine ligase [Thalassolituus alkanivorans]
MITVHTIRELREHVRNARNSGRRIGFVPTMGNLHEGHISLIERSLTADCFTVSSIFVNPLQFNDKSDLARYPRTLPADQEKLAAAGCDLLFAPDVDEMYPNGQDAQSIVHVPVVSEGLCGGSRPGHFDGVSTVVSKLFNQVLPDMAFFGEKDFQQVAVIRKMVNDLCMPVEIVPVPTKRAADGLALSSRNGYLSAEERALAPGLYQTLSEIADDFKAGKDLSDSLKNAEERLNQRGFRTDYLEIRRTSDLAPATLNDHSVVVLGAAFLGSARLIDNLQVTLNQAND